MGGGRKNASTIYPAPTQGNVHMRPALFLCSSLGGLSMASDDFHLNTAAAPCQEWRPLRATLLREFWDEDLTLGGPSVTAHIPYRFGKLRWASLARCSILSYLWPVWFIETTCLSLKRDDTWPSVGHVFRKATLNEGVNGHHHFHFSQEGHIGYVRIF